MNSPSIFNDVIGPVMRGPSSSHCAGALRIGRLARDLMEGNISEVHVEYDSSGSLATTHRSHGSDMGLFAGLLGWDAEDKRMTDSELALKQKGISLDISIRNYGASHPSEYLLHLRNSREEHGMKAISTGGGMIEVTGLDDFEISMAGDFYETLIFTSSDSGNLFRHLSDTFDTDVVICHKGPQNDLIEVKGQHFPDPVFLSDISDKYRVDCIKKLSPVLPIFSRKNMTVPFSTTGDMLSFNRDRGLDLWELAVQYESVRGNVPKETVFEKMKDIIRVMQESAQKGLKGSHYDDRMLDSQCGLFQAHLKKNSLLDGGMLNRIILYTTVFMETKSSMGLIVATPTAGSCGALPGACIGAAAYLGLTDDDITRAMLAAGLIGIFIAGQATFSAEIGGCQVECGAGSSMAAAGLVTLGGGNAEQAVAAASMALQNVLGLVCDPVANRVEVPCLGRNVMAASNALACANMAMAGFDQVIPLDEVINSMMEIGKGIPHELRCTGLGGLSTTPTSKSIKKNLDINTLKNKGG